jgi:hypothetical protein
VSYGAGRDSWSRPGVCNPVSESTVEARRPGKLWAMEAKITQAARQAVMAASQRLDSEEQVSKFLAHSRMMVALYQAGRKIRTSARRR